MDVTLHYGRREAHLLVPDTTLIASEPRAAIPPLVDLASAVRNALEQPFDYPALRRAVTPDDPIAILVDERLPQLPLLLVPVLEHLVSAGITPEAITLVCAPPSTGQLWLDELPEHLEEVRCEIHDPHDRKRLSFVTNTEAGRPFYFNRTAVDAAQMVVLSRCRYDTLMGYGGGAGWLYETFGDQATREASSRRVSMEMPTRTPWPILTEALEATWLLGAPFFLQVLEGHGDDIADVLAGSAPSLLEGERRLDALWRRSLPRRPDMVIASLSGDPRRHGLNELADALTCAARVVRPEGRIILLSEAAPDVGPSLEMLRHASDPQQVAAEYGRRKDLDLRASRQWAEAADQASIYLLSNMPGEVVEDLFATPLEDLSQVQRLLEQSKGCVYLEDAHKMLAVIE